MGTQSPVPREVDLPPTMPSEPVHSKPIPAVTKTQPDPAASSRKRIRSPIRRSLRSHSPKTSSGDLLDSSLDNEMRAAGVDVDDSFDSSEGVGFSDSNLDTSVLGSDQSVTKEGAGRPHPLRTAWEEQQQRTDQAQATTGSNTQKQEVDGQAALTELVEGVRGVGEAVESGQLSSGRGGGELSPEGRLSPGASEGDIVATSQEKG